MNAADPLSKPLDWTSEILIELHKLLIGAYGNPAEARMLADQAGIDAGTFPIDQPNMRELWRELCAVLAEQGKLRRLVEIAVDDPTVAAYRSRFAEILTASGNTEGEAQGPITSDAIPKRELLFIDEDSTRVYASKTEKVRHFDVTALVFDVNRRGSIHPRFVKMFEEVLSPQEWADLQRRVEEAIKNPDQANLEATGGERQNSSLGQSYGYKTPVLIPLGTELSNLIMPNAVVDRPCFLIATTTVDARTSTALGELAQEVLQLAVAAKIRRLAIPLFQYNGAPPNNGAARGAAHEAIYGIWSALQTLPIGSLDEITLAVADDVYYSAAREKANLLTRNRPQRVFNDEPAAEDWLGIAPEVNALAETLLLREVMPPMAVGILGGWGSGKSTVMRLMQKRMSRVRIGQIKKGWSTFDDDPDLPMHAGHIYQITFNAWTYAKSNLWASLMQTIFFELNRQLTREQELKKDHPPLEGGPLYQDLYGENAIDDPGLLWKTLRKHRKNLLDDLLGTEQEIGNVKEAREMAVDIRHETIREKIGQEVQRVALEVLDSRVRATLGEQYQEFKNHFFGEADAGNGNEATNVEAEQQADDDPESPSGMGKETRQLVKDADEILEALRTVYTTYLKVRELNRRNPLLIPVMVFVGVMAVVIGVILATTTTMDDFQKVLTVAASFIPLVLPPLRLAAGWSHQVGVLADEYMRLEERERERYQALWDESAARLSTAEELVVNKILSDKDLDEDEKEKQLSALRSKGNLAAFDHKLTQLAAQADEQRRNIGPTAEYRSLLEFVQARQDEKFYENQLGLMHQVQRDIEELTNGLTLTAEERAYLPEVLPIVLGNGKVDPDKEFHKWMLSEKIQMFPRGEPRVVLYIDDLDRCPPDRVVQVMEAVQLLLRTRLFIVVLGLDTRYVTLALEKEYIDILRHEGDPSGLDYIEKILQIPYRVPPIREDKVQSFLNMQMDIVREESTSREKEQEEEDDEDTYQYLDGQKHEFDPPPDKKGEDGNGQPGPVELEALADLSPEVIRFQPEDLDDMEQCCQQINLTPRNVKRLINVLKLVEVFWFRTLGEGRERYIKKCMISLLALAAGYPEIMREVFAKLDTEYRDREKLGTLIGEFLLKEFELPELLQQAYGWQMERFYKDVTALETIGLDGEPVDVGFFDVTLEQLGRSSFNLVRSFSFVGDPSYAFDHHLADQLADPPDEAEPETDPPDEVDKNSHGDGESGEG